MSKKNIILASVLAVLLLAAYLYNGPYKDWNQSRLKSSGIIQLESAENISRIEISSPQESLAFDKVGEKWLVEGTKDFWLKDEAISRIKSALEEAGRVEPELVSQSAENKADFGTGENGTEIVVKAGEEELASFVLGNTAPDFASAYVSHPDISETYLYKAGLNSAFKNQEWLDRTIFEFDKEQVAKIRFQYPTREFSVEKEEDSWTGTLPYRFSVDNETVDEIVAAMSSLRAIEVPEQSFEGTGLEKNSIIVEASGEDFSHIIMVGDPKTREGEEGVEIEGYYAKRGDSDNIYLISEANKEKLDQTISSLR